MSIIQKLGRYERVMKAVAAAAAAGPIAFYAGEWLPEWPGVSPIGVLSFTLILSIGSVGAGLLLRVEKDHNIRRFGLRALLFGCGVLFLYACLTQLLVVVVTQIQDGQPVLIRVTTGWSLLPGVPFDSSGELLRQFGTPERVWTHTSLATARALLLMLFALGFCGLTSGLACLSRIPSRAQRAQSADTT